MTTEVNRITVYHLSRDGGETKVAYVYVDAAKTVNEQLEYAYRWTQNIHDGWSQNGEKDGNNNVELLAPLHEKDGQLYGLRSTMIDDLMRLNSVYYTVASFGFEEGRKIL